MDLVVIILTVFLGGIVLVLATLWAWFGPIANSFQSFFRKASPTCSLEEEQTSPRGTLGSSSRAEKRIGSLTVAMEVRFRSFFSNNNDAVHSLYKERVLCVASQMT